MTLLDYFPAADLETFAVWPSSQYVPLRLRMAIDLLAEKMPAVVSHLISAANYKAGHALQFPANLAAIVEFPSPN